MVLGFAASASVLNQTIGTIVSSGEKREYLLYVPKSYDRAKPTPLVMSLHGAAMWPTSQMNISQWNLVADEHGFIVVYPAGTGRGPKIWHVEAEPASTTDVIFISELIDTLEAPTTSTRRGSTQMGSPTAAAWRSCCPARCPIESRRSGWWRPRDHRRGAGAQTTDRCR